MFKTLELILVIVVFILLIKVSKESRFEQSNYELSIKLLENSNIILQERQDSILSLIKEKRVKVDSLNNELIIVKKKANEKVNSIYTLSIDSQITLFTRNLSEKGSNK